MEEFFKIVKKADQNLPRPKTIIETLSNFFWGLLTRPTELSKRQNNTFQS
jgi:hypothetical protein